MDEALIDSIRAQILKEHGIAIERSDPVFAILTAYKIVHNEFINKIEVSNKALGTEMESMAAKYIADLKDLGETKMTAAFKEVFAVLEEKHKQALAEIEKSKNAAVDSLLANQKETKINYIVSGVIAGAFLIIGILVGKLI